jgi:glyoxylase-like metal-dependent hydrolase (beta-lactamase superfamily II)/rhodanese-related sulfurtransferase
MTDYRDPEGEVASLSPDALADRLAAGEPVRVLDVRNRDEFEAWHVEGPSVTTTLVPYMKWVQADATDSVADRAADVDGEGPILVVCARGEASAYVADLLDRAGHDATNLDGGMEAWARVSRTAELATDGPSTVVQYRRPSTGCLGYLVVAGDEAVVVDPLRAFVDRYVDDAATRGAEITTVVDTHVHADHVSGLRELADRTGATPVVPRMSIERGVTYDAEPIIHGEELAVGDTAMEAIHLPGHTTGMTAFLLDGVLLAGDSLFVESVARPDLEEGADGAPALAAQLYESLTARLADLPDETLVAPGHYSPDATPREDGAYAAPLGDLRDRLAVFSMDRQSFTGRIVMDTPDRPANFQRIVAINLGLEDADDEDAFELELGPNNCAASPDLAD